MMIRRRFLGSVLAINLLAGSLTTACGDRTNSSLIKVSDVAHTPVKRQSIGNCWLYATSTWAESLHLSATENVVNLSESYWTYWDWYHKLVSSKQTAINTGGGWKLASNIIAKHGYMLENEFIAEEADSEMSSRQLDAEGAINLALTEGSLKNPESRTSENVMNALDKAFGIKMSEAKTKAHPASDLVTGTNSDGTKRFLAEEIAGGRHQWRVLDYPQLFGSNPRETFLIRRQRAKVIDRVLRAVNDKKPVIMSTMIEFSALNTESNATFEYDLYIKRGYSTGQGGHLVVLEDYVVDNVPGVGSIGEGDVSPELKDAALRGDVRYFVTKNSWGTDREERGLSDGYTRFTMKYLNNPLPFGLEDDESDISNASWFSALSDFIVPPEY
jgi:hypothetical protein